KKRSAMGVALALLVSAAASGAKVTVDDLMKARSILDVRISPDGESIAYAVSTPSLERNAHEPAIWVVSARGGAPRRIAEGAKIFGRNLPVPRLRWAPDDATVACVGVAAGKPQVFAAPVAGGEAKAITSAPEGAFGYEWSPDGKSLAYVTVDPPSEEEQRRRKDRSFVIHVDAPEPARRLCIQVIGGASRTLSPPGQYVEGISWSPDGKEIAYAAAPATGFMAQYSTRIYAVAVEGGAPRAIVDRPGMNSSPQFSPDGSRIAFVSSNGRSEIMAPRSLAVVAARGDAATRVYGMDD